MDETAAAGDDTRFPIFPDSKEAAPWPWRWSRLPWTKTSHRLRNQRQAKATSSMRKPRIVCSLTFPEVSTGRNHKVSETSFTHSLSRCAVATCISSSMSPRPRGTSWRLRSSKRRSWRKHGRPSGLYVSEDRRRCTSSERVCVAVEWSWQRWSLRAGAVMSCPVSKAGKMSRGPNACHFLLALHLRSKLGISPLNLMPRSNDSIDKPSSDSWPGNQRKSPRSLGVTHAEVSGAFALRRCSVSHPENANPAHRPSGRLPGPLPTS